MFEVWDPYLPGFLDDGLPFDWVELWDDVPPLLPSRLRPNPSACHTHHRLLAGGGGGWEHQNPPGRPLASDSRSHASRPPQLPGSTPSGAQREEVRK